MEYLHWLAGQVVGVVDANKGWMVWNTLLAAVAGGLAFALSVPGHRRSFGWWLGAGAFVLFLPNAPYVVTDLIHVRADIAAAESDGVVLAGILPLYAGFVIVGFEIYRYCLDRVVDEVRSVRPSVARWAVELPVHLICSVGIVLGRMARLNSWDSIASPIGTLEETFTTLTWRGAPVAVGAVFVAVWLTYTVIRVLTDALLAWADRHLRPARLPSS